MPEWKGRVPLTRSHCERITVPLSRFPAQRNTAHTAHTARNTGRYDDVHYRAVFTVRRPVLDLSIGRVGRGLGAAAS
ncbi:hypothetical protein EVAR_53476_1 [Eumeta japonica]|uniref:Uncharacterized protein n=1 Tax=Eumeta variegata TaxID=151549 RepID=A0A4C1YR90_EUMVA|nr:hypothetical protein EVAR_53476_1 [Eumeta japonica]